MPGHAFPADHPGDEKELLLDWLGFLRDVVVRKASVEDRQAHWRPEHRLLTLVGIVNHLTHVEWRWIDGGFLGVPIGRSEAEFHPGEELVIASALDAYQQRAGKTDALMRSTPLDARCRLEGEERVSLRWVLLHLINETARHAGHADAVRELLDGTTGEQSRRRPVPLTHPHPLASQRADRGIGAPCPAQDSAGAGTRQNGRPSGSKNTRQRSPPG